MSNSEDILSIREASFIGRVKRQAVYVAIRKGRLRAKKINNKWLIKSLDLEDYRLNKYNRDFRQIDGEYVFDMEKGEFSVQQVCKVISATLNRPFPMQRLYYLLRTGRIKSLKKGAAWVILKEDAIALLESEMIKNQMVGV